MTTVVTYDAVQSHSELKRQLFLLPFYNCISMKDGSKKVLPNTTVLHPSDNIDTVMRDFDKAVSLTQTPPIIEKVCFVPFGGGEFYLRSNKSC
jgi:hypothetical protein